MNKKFLKCSTLVLSAAMLGATVVSTAACGDEVDSTGVNTAGATKITFWGYGDENEKEVFRGLVDDFNKLHEGDVYVTYDPRPNDKYADTVSMALMSSKAKVDVLYIEDANVKSWAELGYLEPLDSYIAQSSEIDPDNMWDSSINRYKYDVNTTTQDGPNAHYWGLPKDIGPTVIFYNETHFTQAGIKVISVAADKLAAFNAGAADDRGQTKEALGLTDTVKEKGYFIDSKGQQWFNNQVPMSWEECVALARVIQNDQRNNHGNKNYYGYFTEWWFNYGWSVGGDCVEYVADEDGAYNGGWWDFTLMEDTPNYIVADDAQPYTVNGNTYQPGEIIAWADKLKPESLQKSKNITDKASRDAAKKSEADIRDEVKSAAADGRLNELPSQRDAFVEFLRVGQAEGVTVDGDLQGYGVCASPDAIGGADSAKTTYFMSGGLGMLVDGRWNVVNFRKKFGDIPGQADPSKGQYEWDVAPLPMYKTYYEEGDQIPSGKEVGDIKVHGIEAGHSGSVSVAINAKSTKKDAAWKFVEYIGGKTGQARQAESGFAIPSQKDLANSDVFLQPGRNPRNAIVFVRAAEAETPGDWWYLKDKKWIDPWANVLNGNVRKLDANHITLSAFEENSNYITTWKTLKGYTAK